HISGLSWLSGQSSPRSGSEVPRHTNSASSGAPASETGDPWLLADLHSSHRTNKHPAASAPAAHHGGSDTSSGQSHSGHTASSARPPDTNFQTNQYIQSGEHGLSSLSSLSVHHGANAHAGGAGQHHNLHSTHHQHGVHHVKPQAQSQREV